MPVDPYQNCPCGSGKKFKWCCQKLAKYVEKAEGLLEKDQLAAALQALDEGLAVEPTSLWLRTMKAQILMSVHDHEPAHQLIEEILSSQPGYRPALLLRLQDQLGHGAAPDAVATLDVILESVPADERDASLGWICLVGRSLHELHEPFAALAHLRFVVKHESWAAEVEPDVRALEGSQEFAPWLKHAWDLRAAPGSEGTVAQRWREAVVLAEAGRWGKSAAMFETVTAERPEIPTAWFNLGICLGWSARDEAAANALARYAALEPDPELALDGEVLAQCLDPRESGQSVDVVRIRYPIRDRTRLIQNLKEHRHLQAHFLDAADERIDPDVRDEFYLLDKPTLENLDSVTLENLPAIVGLLRTRGEDLELEFAEPAADDTRPRLTLEAAGDTIDPNGNREVVGTLPVSTYRMRRMWGMPPGSRPEITHQIRRIVHEQMYRDVWPNTPHGWLENKTPREASQVPELKRSLRAALLLVEYTSEASQFDIDVDGLRSTLGLEREPTLEGADRDVDRLPLGRLRQVRAETLSTPRLRALFERAMRYMLTRALEYAAAAIVARPAEREQFNTTAAFKLLIDLASARFDRAAATQWIERARRFDAEAGAQPGRPTWEFAEWQTSLRFDGPHEWAPRLAELLTNYGKDKDASSELMSMLLAAGLVRLVPHPSVPNRVALDTQLLDQILARYGTRQPGMLDLTPVAAGAPGKLWTPGADRPTAAPVWSPGQQPPAERPKIILPGS